MYQIKYLMVSFEKKNNYLNFSISLPNFNAENIFSVVKSGKRKLVVGEIIKVIE